MGLDIQAFIERLQTSLIPATAWAHDRIGLQLQSGRSSVQKILVTMEITDAVVTEAIARGIEMIVTFHPLIFSPLSALTESERVGRICSRLIRNDIAVYSVHTMFDAHPKGGNSQLAENLGLVVQQPLVANERYEHYGMGRIAVATPAITPEELLRRLSTVCGKHIRWTPGKNTMITTVALVVGSGFSYITEALRNNVDAFVTADCKYHDFHAVDEQLWLIDAGHYESEQFVAQGIADILSAVFQPDDGIEVYLSDIVPNPLRYYTD